MLVKFPEVPGNEFGQRIPRRVYMLKVKSPGWDKLP